MKLNIQLSIIFILMIVGLSVPVSYSQLPAYTMTLTNDTMSAPNVYEFDIYLLRTDTTIFQLFGFQMGILYDSTLFNDSTLTASWVPGSTDSTLVKTNQVSNSIKIKMGIMWIDPKVAFGFGNGAIISNVAPGTKVGRLRLTTSNSSNLQKANIAWNFSPPWKTAVAAFNYKSHLSADITVPANHFISFHNHSESPPSLK